MSPSIPVAPSNIFITQGTPCPSQRRGTSITQSPQNSGSGKEREESEPSTIRKRCRPRKSETKIQKKKEESLWSVRDIIDESDTKYLIDWEDHPITGESYEPSWEPKHFVTKLAIEDWEKKKRKRKRRSSIRAELADSSPARPSKSIVPATIQDSEPVRPAKRRKRATEILESPLNNFELFQTSPNQPESSEKSRKVQVQSAGLSILHSQKPGRDEIEDSLELHPDSKSGEGLSFSLQSQLQSEQKASELSRLHPRVEIEVPKSLNREEYIQFSQISTSLSQEGISLKSFRAIAHSGPELVIEDSQTQSESTVSEQISVQSIQVPATAEELVIPDSQDIPDIVGKTYETPERQQVDYAQQENSDQDLDLDAPNRQLESEIAASQRSAVEGLDHSNQSLPSVQIQNVDPLDPEPISAEIQSPPFPSLSSVFYPRIDEHSEEQQFQTQVPYFREGSIIDGDILLPKSKTSSPKRGQATILFDNEKPLHSSSEICQGGQIAQPLDLSSQENSSCDKIKSRRGSHLSDIFQPSTNSPLGPRNPNSQRSPEHFKRSDSIGAQKPGTKQVAPENIIASVEEGPTGEDLEPLHRPFANSSGLHRGLLDHNTDMTDQRFPGFPAGMSLSEIMARVRERSLSPILSDVEYQNQMIQATTISPADLISRELPMRETQIAASGPSLEPSPNFDREASPDKESISLLPIGPMEHLIVLPMANMVRAIYEHKLSVSKTDILKFLDEEKKDPTLLGQLDQLIHELELLGDHQDLLDEDPSQHMTDTLTAKWAVTCSSKCAFLQDLLNELRSLNVRVHIAILARPGKMLDILESIMKRCGYSYDRPDRGRKLHTQDSLKVSLLPTGLEGELYKVDRSDAVIAFDSSFFLGERYSKTLRTHPFEPYRLSPLLYLVVFCTVSHFQLCLRKSLDPIDRKSSLLQLSFHQRNRVGILDSEMPRPEDMVPAIAQYLTSNPDIISPWPLLENSIIDGVEVPEKLLQRQSGSTTQSKDDGASNAMKRPYEDLSEDDVSKRLRMTPVPIETSGGEITRIGDSIGYASQFNAAKVEHQASDAIAASSALDDAQSDKITKLLGRVADLQIQLHQKDAEHANQIREKEKTEASLRQKIDSLHSRLESHAKTINKLQPLYHDTLTARARFETEAIASEERAQTLSKRLEARSNEVTTLKTKITSLESELSASSQALLSSTDPNVVDLEATKLTLKAAKAEKERLERRVASMQRDFDFTRDAYQKASSSASELGVENATLQAQIEELKRKADDNVVKIQEIQRRNHDREREERVDELEAENMELKAELAKKAEEARLRGLRRDTRGQSVPRSPRLGSVSVAGQASPRQGAMGVRGGSRAGSLAPGPEGGSGAGYPPRWNELRES